MWMRIFPAIFGALNSRISNTKRGNIDLGTNDDTLTISSLTNNGDWSNAFYIDAAEGADEINLLAGDEASADNYRFASSIVDGSETTFYIDLGADSDSDTITTELLSDLELTNFDSGTDIVEVLGGTGVSITNGVATVTTSSGTFEVSADTALAVDDFLLL